MTYLPTILWIDDEVDKLTAVIHDAKAAGITLEPFRTLAEGMDALKTNYERYDAVLLDAKFGATEEDKVFGTENSTLAHLEIAKLSDKKELEVFVLSGLTRDQAVITDAYQKSFKGKVYRKGMEADLDRLWMDLEAAANRQPTVQIRRKYANALAACQTGYLGKQAGDILIGLLQHLENDTLEIKDLNEIRKVVETLVTALRRRGDIPKDITKLNPTANYLGGVSTRTDNKRWCSIDRDSFPQEVGKLLNSLVTTTQVGSHPLYLDWLIREKRSDYWLKASLYQLLSLLEWYTVYKDSGQMAEEYHKQLPPTAAAVQKRNLGQSPRH